MYWPTFNLKLALYNVLEHFVINTAFVYNTLSSILGGSNQSVGAAAWTEIAAQLLSGDIDPFIVCSNGSCES